MDLEQTWLDFYQPHGETFQTTKGFKSDDFTAWRQNKNKVNKESLNQILT